MGEVPRAGDGREVRELLDLHGISLIAIGYEWLPHYDFALLRRTGIR